MKDPDNQEKLTLLPVQLVETTKGVILKRGCVEVKIDGERAAESVRAVLAAAANGGVTPAEVCAAFAAPDRPAVGRLVEQLRARRLLVPRGQEAAPGVPESSLEVFNWHFGERAGRLDNRHIVIVGVNCISRQLAAALVASGVERVDVVDCPLLRNLRLFDDQGGLRPAQWPAPARPPLACQGGANGLGPEAPDCLVATSDFGGQQLMREWNEFCVGRRCHFLPVVLQDLIGYVGPLVVPGETPCFECLRARQNAHMEDPDSRRASEYVAYEGQAVAGFHPSMASVLGDIAAVELTKFYSGLLPWSKVGTLIEVNLLAARMDARKVLKLPRCPVCSTLNTRSSVSPAKNIIKPGQPDGDE